MMEQLEEKKKNQNKIKQTQQTNKQNPPANLTAQNPKAKKKPRENKKSQPIPQFMS